MKSSLLKKIFVISLVGVISLTLFGCGNNVDNKKENKTTQETSVLAKIKKNNKLVVGLSADYAPYEFHKIIDGKDTIVGFDPAIASEIAKDLGVELEFKDMEFNSLIGALPSGKIDMIISGMSKDPEREKAVDFSDIYYEAEHGLLIRKDDKENYKTVKDFEGKKVGAQMGSIQAEIAKNEMTGADIKLVGKVNSLILELKAGKIEGLITELPVAEMAVKSNPELDVAETKIKDEAGGSAIAVKKGEKEFLDEINKTIKRLKEENKINEFVIKAQELAQE